MDRHPAHHLLSDFGFAVFSLIIIVAFFVSAFLLRPLLGGQLAAVVSATLVTLANEDRAQEDLGKLKVNPLLVAAAQAKADDMAAKGYFAHVSPDGTQPWFWLQQAGYGYAHAGENLAVNFSDSENVEEAWMDSPAHRANILDERFTEVGIATAVGEYKGKKTTFVVQMFGTPAAVAVVPAAPVTPSEPVAVIPEDPEVPAVVSVAEPVAEEVVPEAPAVLQAVAEVPQSGAILMSSPEKLLQGIYVSCALILLLALILVTRMEFKRHHFQHVVAVGCLLLLMGGLFIVADRLIFTDPIIAGAWAAS